MPYNQFGIFEVDRWLERFVVHLCQRSLEIVILPNGHVQQTQITFATQRRLLRSAATWLLCSLASNRSYSLEVAKRILIIALIYFPVLMRLPIMLMLLVLRLSEHGSSMSS